MTAYVIFDAPPTSDLQREAMKPYGDKAWDTLKPYGGKPIVRTNEIEVREVNPDRSWTPTRLLIIEFPTVAAARAWYDSPEYQALLPIRLNARGPDNMVIVDGVKADT
jgi:uncharacterized protein (DUF1330 family)